MEHKIQGDILFLKLNMDIKADFQPLESEGVIVAYGEATGHHHKVVARPNSIVEIAQDEKGYYLKVLEGEAEVLHQKHAGITFGIGTWFIRRQREYSEIEKWRSVQD